jgi:hypothetical protein
MATTVIPDGGGSRTPQETMRVGRIGAEKGSRDINLGIFSFYIFLTLIMIISIHYITDNDSEGRRRRVQARKRPNRRCCDHR